MEAQQAPVEAPSTSCSTTKGVSNPGHQVENSLQKALGLEDPVDEADPEGFFRVNDVAQNEQLLGFGRPQQTR
jgi:hypothetical protein